MLAGLAFIPEYDSERLAKLYQRAQDQMLVPPHNAQGESLVAGNMHEAAVRMQEPITDLTASLRHGGLSPNGVMESATVRFAMSMELWDGFAFGCSRRQVAVNQTYVPRRRD
jgi:hypothetical protein